MRARTGSIVAAAGALIWFCVPVWAGWTEPEPVVEINTVYHDKAPFLSYDGKTLYFTRQDGPGWHFTRMYQARRDKLSGAVVVSEISTMNSNYHHVDYPWVSPDNLRMYYYIAWGTTRKLMFTKRYSVDDPWLPGTGVAELNALGDVANPSLTPDELTIFFTGTDVSGGVGGYDIWMATRPDRESPFGDAINLTEINSPGWDFHPSICPDGLTLYFVSVCDEKSRLFRAARASVDEPFGPPEHLSFFDSEGVSLQYPFLGNDGTALYFVGWEDGDTTDIHISYVSDDSEAKTFDMD